MQLYDQASHECTNPKCGWASTGYELANGKCPRCGSEVREVN